MAIIKPVFRVL